MHSSACLRDIDILCKLYHNLHGTPPFRTLCFILNFVLYTDGLLTDTNLLPGVERKSASNSLASVGG